MSFQTRKKLQTAISRNLPELERVDIILLRKASVFGAVLHNRVAVACHRLPGIGSQVVDSKAEIVAVEYR